MIYNEEKIFVPSFKESNGFYTTKKRSNLMGKIKAQDTLQEVKLRRELWRLGYRYRKNSKKLPGKPDIVFTKFKLAIFIDGEFWHGCNWDLRKSKIKSNRDYWIPKIERNMQRDKFNNNLLSNEGWKVMRFWSKDVENDFEGCLVRIEAFIRS